MWPGGKERAGREGGGAGRWIEEMEVVALMPGRGATGQKVRRGLGLLIS